MQKTRLFLSKKAMSEEFLIGLILFIVALLVVVWIIKKKLGSILGF